VKPPRGLTEQEAALWARVAKTVTPLKEGRDPARPSLDARTGSKKTLAPKARQADGLQTKAAHELGGPSKRASRDLGSHGLDSSWDRKLSRGAIQPDFTLDLHGVFLDAAHGYLMQGLTEAKAMGARVVLLVTGKPRPVESADRGQKRGAIRAKVLDWLAHSEHASDIAAIRGAHPRHGGAGALYIILKRKR